MAPTPLIVSLYLRDFYVQAERRLSPGLLGRPVVFYRRGRILAASSEAARCGVSPGQDRRCARRLCPDAHEVEFEAERYTQFSQEALDLAAEYTLRIEPVYPHEAFLDFTGCLQPPRAWETLAERLEEHGFLPLMGIASSKLVARAAALHLNADYLRTGFRRIEPELTPETEAAFLGRLPLGALWPLPERALQKLTRLGLKRIREVADLSPELLARQIGPVGESAWRWARGIDASRVRPLFPPLALIAESAPEDPLTEERGLEAVLARLAQQIAEDLLQRPEACYRVDVVLETGESRRELSQSLRSGVRSEADLLRAALRLARQSPPSAPITGVRLRAGDLRRQEALQPDLLGHWERKRRVAGMWETMKRRFGEGALKTLNVFQVPRRDRFLELLHTSEQAGC